MRQYECATCASSTSYGAYNSFPGGGMKPFYANRFRKCYAAKASGLLFAVLVFAVVMLCAAVGSAENCTTASDIEPATRSALLAAGQHYFDFIAKGDSASLRQNVIPSLASDFSGIETTVKDNQSALA